MTEEDNAKQSAERTVEDIKTKANVIDDRCVHLLDHPEKIKDLQEDTNDILTAIEDMSFLMDRALAYAAKYREQEYDNPECPNCGTEQEVAVTSSNITGYLCPVCDVE